MNASILRPARTLIALSCVLASSAALPSRASEWTVSSQSTVSSQYFGNIVGGRFYSGGAVLYQSLGVSKPVQDGSFYASALVIQPLDRLVLNETTGNEWVATVGRTLELGKDGDGLPAMKLDVFATYDALQPIEKPNDVILLSARLDLPQVPHVQPYAHFYHWEQASDSSPEGGAFLCVGLLRHQPIAFPTNDGEPVPTIDLEYRFGYSDGVFGTKAGPAYHRLIVSYSHRLSRESKWTITPSLIGQTHVGHDTSGTLGRGTRLYGQLTLGWKG